MVLDSAMTYINTYIKEVSAVIKLFNFFNEWQ